MARSALRSVRDADFVINVRTDAPNIKGIDDVIARRRLSDDRCDNVFAEGISKRGQICCLVTELDQMGMAHVSLSVTTLLDEI